MTEFLTPRMKKSIPTLIATLVWSALYSQHALASLAEQCLVGVPTYDKPLVSGDVNDLPVHITADKSEANYPNNALFQGNVDIKQGNSTLTADRVQLDQKTISGQPDPLRTVTATGNVNYADNQIRLQGPSAWSNLNNKDTNVWRGDYQFVGRQGRGDADLMKTRGANRYTILENGTFTSCLPGDNSWSIAGSEIIQDRQEQVAEIWNARFKVGPVPIFYSPYLQFPTGSTRRSGFLIPNVNYSNSDGLEFSLPWYWNIAPQADATITPHYMEKRGLQLQNEFRYLSEFGMGLVEFDWLGNDRQFQQDRKEQGITGQALADLPNRDRWLFYWRHSGVLNHWRFGVDYTKVSDPYYFTDLNSAYGSSTSGYATQKFTLGYAETNWNATLSTTQFQVFANAGDINAYRTQPQLDVNYYKNDLGPFDFTLYGQAVKFTNENPNMPEADRYHLEPTLSLPLANRWASINTEVKLLATHYQQDVPKQNNFPLLKDSVNRVMPEFKVDGKMVFERDTTLLKDYTQTLEPRVQYLYIPYRDQSDIYAYDSTLLQTDYTGLFRDRSYSGLDRIASANQVTTGLTTRLYDEQQNERFNASIGQIYYFSPARTGDETTNIDRHENTGSLVWAGDSYLKLTDNWGLRGGLQYDTRLNSVALGNAVMEYRKDAESVLQLSYRYTSPEYITSMLPRYANNAIYNQGISQAGIIGSLPLAERWAMVAGYYYDTKAKQSADAITGVQYNTCCWSLGVTYERKINSWDKETQSSKYDNRFSLRFSLRGMNQNYSLGSEEMLRTGILPYQRAF
ncbi:LPS assembly protein LptD [Edwardsiella tarda]|uniref:LPS assembly protein LptD n=1 Tax=Edwardsiella tarda TaxID=636 RepID=UPI000D508EE4|nr:LPS assembly protein LptD [Edwardsiella tarda]UCQ27128.1 LPS assembly protein LptD [Edwardsiella tarda]